MNSGMEPFRRLSELINPASPAHKGANNVK